MSFKVKRSIRRNKAASRFGIPVKPRDRAFIDRTIKHYAEYIDELSKSEEHAIGGIAIALENLLLESQMQSLAAGAYHIGKERYPDAHGAILKWGYDVDSPLELWYETIDEIKEMGNKNIRADLPALIKNIERCSDNEFMMVEYVSTQDVFARRIKLPPNVSFKYCAELHKHELSKLDIFQEQDYDDF